MLFDGQFNEIYKQQNIIKSSLDILNNENKLTIIGKRQTGKTTLTLILMLILLKSDENKNCIYISDHSIIKYKLDICKQLILHNPLFWADQFKYWIDTSSINYKLNKLEFITTPIKENNIDLICYDSYYEPYQLGFSDLLITTRKLITVFNINDSIIQLECQNTN